MAGRGMLVVLLLCACSRRDAERDYAEQRAALVRETMQGQGITDARVLDVMRRVPRHRFVPEIARSAAYADRPLQIGFGQTISQPFIVAYMTQAVAPGPKDRCLEIGTGSGYQAAVLAELCAKVWSIEYVPGLAELAKRNLRETGYGPDRVVLMTGDGYRGWPEAAPFDVIVVTAAAPKVPAPLLDQLAVKGRLVAPVGPSDDTQWLELWTRVAQGDGPEALTTERRLPVAFVPLVGPGVRGGAR